MLLATSTIIVSTSCRKGSGNAFPRIDGESWLPKIFDYHIEKIEAFTLDCEGGAPRLLMGPGFKYTARPPTAAGSSKGFYKLKN